MKRLLIPFLVLAGVSLGYYQRDYYAVKAAKARAQESCKAWADEGGSYTIFRDGTFMEMPLRWCDSWRKSGWARVTKGWQSNPQTEKATVVRRWEWN